LEKNEKFWAELDLKVVVAALEKYVKESNSQKDALRVIVREAIVTFLYCRYASI
jgi:hypothetical protein